MGKDSALGQDPLRWIKVTSENKKSFPLKDANATDQNTEKAAQKTNPQTTFKQQMPFPISKEENPKIKETAKPSGKVDRVSDSTVNPKSRVVIGRLYEKPSLEKIKSVFHNEGGGNEVRHRTELSPSGLGTVQPMKRVESQINHIPGYASTSRISTYIIIAYTALMLILGGLVYNDLSKRTSRIETKILAIEKALRLNQKR